MSRDRGALDLILEIEDERLGVAPLGTILLLPIMVLLTAAPGLLGAPATVRVALAAVPALLSAFAWGGGAGALLLVIATALAVPSASVLPLYDKLGLVAQFALGLMLVMAAAQGRSALRAAHVYRGLMLRETEEEIHALANAAAHADDRAVALEGRLETERRMTTALQRLQGEGGPREVADRITRLVGEALGRGTIFLVGEGGAGASDPEPMSVFVSGDGGARNHAVDPVTVPPFVRRVLSLNRPVIARDAGARDAGARDAGVGDADAHSPGPCGSLIAVLLKTGLTDRAVLVAAHPEQNQFGIDDLRLLDHFTIPAGLALANADYMTETKRLATEDGLTGFLLRGPFDEVLATELIRARRYRHSLAVFILDLDKFKSLNDEHGHSAGDEALRRTAEALRAALPSFAKVGRIGGEEFAVVLPECEAVAAKEAAEVVRQQLRAKVARPDSSPLTASLGVAGSWSLTADDGPEVLLKMADAALYRAKESGRDRVVVDDRTAETRNLSS